MLQLSRAAVPTVVCKVVVAMFVVQHFLKLFCAVSPVITLHARQSICRIVKYQAFGHPVGVKALDVLIRAYSMLLLQGCNSDAIPPGMTTKAVPVCKTFAQLLPWTA